jgi:hypothetical protein
MGALCIDGGIVGAGKIFDVVGVISHPLPD